MEQGNKKKKKGTGGTRCSPRLQALRDEMRQKMKRNGKRQSKGGIEIRDQFRNANLAKEMIRGETGIVYHQEMEKHFNTWDEEHIEGPERSKRTWNRCKDMGLVERCKRIEARKAKKQELRLVHTEKHLQTLEEVVEMGEKEIERLCLEKYHSVYLNKDSMEAAMLAAGSAVELSEAVVKGEIQNGLAIIRPPGHHAMKEEMCGFCLCNNVAIAAKNAKKNLGVERIIIVDFDVHHGQATQREFYDDPSVMYVSIHRYEYGSFWPHLRESDYDHVGKEEGLGCNINLPLNATGMGDADYLAIFHQLILPVAYEFQPELVLVSAGYDAAIGCPEGEMKVSPITYGHIVNALMGLAGGKVAVLMEGGYFVESLAEGVAMTLRALLGDPSMPLPPLGRPGDSVADSILNSVSALRSYWNMIQVQEEYSISEYDACVDKNCHEPTIFYDTSKDSHAGEYYYKHSEETKLELLDILSDQKKRYAHLLEKTGIPHVSLVYDDNMRRHANLGDPNHPERPMRISRMMEMHKDYGIFERTNLKRIPSRRANMEEVLLCHDKQHYEAMSSLPNKSQDELDSIADALDSIYLNKDSFDCALLSCGSLLNVVDSVCQDESRSGVAIIRPPGHHAESDEACGFCIFNNVAVAAKYALQMHNANRVMILDWDVHHGNGIQNMFYDDPSVLYVSTHRYDHATFFPCRKDANYDFVGEGRGQGYNINIPWNGSGMGDAEYISALFNVILPVAYQFCPDLILISAGFDAARGDPLGHCNVSPETYGNILQQLRSLANGKVIVALEGGYNLNSISLSMTMCTKALLGDPMPPVILDEPPKASALESIRNVIQAHSKYWSSLRFGLKLPDSFDDLKEQLEENIPKAAVKATPPTASYIPKEFGEFSPAQVVNTLSKSLPKASEFLSKGTKEEKEDGIDEKLSKLSLDQNPKAEGGLVGDSNDYVPSEYGNPVESSSINTISSSVNAGAKSECSLTEAPKQK